MKNQNDYQAQAGSKGLLPALALLFFGFLMIMFSSAIAQDPDYTLHIKGSIVENDSAAVTLLILEFDEETDKWVKYEVYEDITTYEIALSASKDYQVWFTSGKNSKMMCVLAGEVTNDYYYQLDVDFSNDDCCIIYRDPAIATDRYFIDVVSCKQSKKTCAL